MNGITGQVPSDRVCNIYDLEGCHWEYIAERIDSANYCSIRGGTYTHGYPASRRAWDIRCSKWKRQYWISICTLCHVAKFSKYHGERNSKYMINTSNFIHNMVKYE